jgi:hypothetical protein
MNRKSGLYWVKVNAGAEWQIARWSEGQWCVLGSEASLDGSHPVEIGPRLAPAA